MYTEIVFVPPDIVRHAFQEIKPLLPQEAEDFAMYFEWTYIGQYSAFLLGTDELRPKLEFLKGEQLNTKARK